MTRRRLVLWVIAISVLAFAKYGRTLAWPLGPGPFLDDFVIMHRIAVQPFWVEVKEVFSSPFVPVMHFYRPVGMLSFLVDQQIWRRPIAKRLSDGSLNRQDLETQMKNPSTALPYRVTSLSLFVAASILFGIMLKIISGSWKFGVVGGLLYTVWPTNALVVTWVSARFDSLLAPLFFSGVALFILWVRGRGARYLFGAIAAYVFALGSKETAMILPVILVAFWVFLGRKENWKRWAIGLALLVAILSIFILARVNALDSFTTPQQMYGLYLTRYKNLWIDFMLGPILDLGIMFKAYTTSLWALLDPNFWRALFGQAALWSTVALLLWKKWRLAIAFYLWMGIGYLPVSVYHAIIPGVKHWLFFPSIGIIALVALAICQWQEFLWQNLRFSWRGIRR